MATFEVSGTLSVPIVTRVEAATAADAIALAGQRTAPSTGVSGGNRDKEWCEGEGVNSLTAQSAVQIA